MKTGNISTSNTIPLKFPAFKRALSWSLDELEGYFNSWSAIQKIKSDERYNPADETIQRIKEINTQEILEVTFPVFMRLGRMKK